MPTRKRYEVRRLVSRRSRPNEKGYTWTMGYNNVVGRWTDGRDYSRFSGSSYNRSLLINTYAKDLYTITDDLIKMAVQVAIKMSGIPGWEVSGEIHDIFMRPNPESARIYTLWIRSKIPGDDIGLSFGIRILSERSRGKVKDKATAFYRACPGSRIFCTLTFIDRVSDSSGVVILNKFLTAIRSEFSGVQYLWVAERQENGNIHFHIILNKRLPVKRWNGMWVLQQYNSGLTGKNKYGEVISMAEINDRFSAGTIGKVLNPLDVKPVRSIGGLSGYLTKYITKQEKNVPFDCSVWHCSRGVSRLFTKAVVGPSAFRYCCSFNNSKLDKETGELLPVQAIVKPFYVMAYINNKNVPLSYLKELEQINKWIISGMRLEKLPECSDTDYKKYFLCEN
jgi:hypothetical protein